MRSDFQNKGIELARRAARTRPARRLADAIREDAPEPAPPPPPPEPEPVIELHRMRVDAWLTSLFAAELDEIEGKLEAGAWCRCLRAVPGTRRRPLGAAAERPVLRLPGDPSFLPDVPDPDLQVAWNGADSLWRPSQSNAFYGYVKDRYAADHDGDLIDARILDFGCGWGRLTRFFARDVPPGSLIGCDPVESILDVSRRSRVPAELHRSDFVPTKLPVSGIDVAFSFSVFTHLSEAAAASCLDALHDALNPGGLLILTIRPPDYLSLDEKMHAARDALGADPLAAMSEPRFVFAPHAVDDAHPQHQGEEMTYGDSVVSLAYVRERWTEQFELIDVKVILEDMFQVAVTLRKR